MSEQYSNTGVVKVLKKRFGLITSPDFALDVFFELGAVECASGGGDDAAAPSPPPPAPLLNAGDAVAFTLAPDSRPGRPAAARVRGLDEAGAAAAAAPSLPRRVARCVGVVAAAPGVLPAPGNGAGGSGSAAAAWARSRGGLIRFLLPPGLSDSVNGSSSSGGGSGADVRHVAFGAADVSVTGGGGGGNGGDAAVVAEEASAAAARLTAGMAVTFDLVQREPRAPPPPPLTAPTSQQQQQQNTGPARPRDGRQRAAFWAAYGAARVAPLSAPDEARLAPEPRRQLAVLRLLVDADDAVAAAAAEARAEKGKS